MLLLRSFFTPAFAALYLTVSVSNPIHTLEQPSYGTENPSPFSVSHRMILTNWQDRDTRTQIPGEGIYLTIDNYGFHSISPRWALVVAQSLAVIEARLRSNLTRQVLDQEFTSGPVQAMFTRPFRGISITPSQAAVVIRLLRFWTIAFGGPKEVLASTIETNKDLLALFSLKIALSTLGRGTI